MENKKPIEIAVYMRVGNASQLNHKDKKALTLQVDKLHAYKKLNNS